MEECENCSGRNLTFLTRAPRQKNSVRAIGVGMMVLTTLACGSQIFGSLPVARSGSIESGVAWMVIFVSAAIWIPFLIWGGYLVLSFKKNVWRCRTCGHLQSDPGWQMDAP